MAIESPTQPASRRPADQPRDGEDKKETREKNENTLNILSNTTPKQTVEQFRQLMLNDMARIVPQEFGNLQLTGASQESTTLAAIMGKKLSDTRGGRRETAQERYEKMDPPEPEKPKTARTETTNIYGTGAASGTKAEIKYGEDGKPHTVKDSKGVWNSDDGGKTWKSGEPRFETRRGSVGIDEKKNFSYENTDYGMKFKFSPDGTSQRSITTTGGDTYSVTRDKKGVPTSISDKGGDWTSKDGKSWTNDKTNETKSGTPTLTEYGEYRFKPAGKGDTQIAQSPELERINKLKGNIEEKHSISIAKPGEVKEDDEQNTPEANFDGKGIPVGPIARPLPPGEERKAGMPTEQELKTLDRILDKTNHENYRDMKVWFLHQGQYGRGGMAVYSNDGGEGNSGEQHQHSGGCCGNKGVVVAKNGDLVINPPARQVTDGFDTFERTGLHELAHHEQHQKIGPAEFVGKGSTPETQQMAKDMGWEYSKRHDKPVYLDKDGGKWMPPGPDSKDDSFRWVGGIQPKDGKHRIDPYEMRERAKVKPLTWYNTSPHETHAEALGTYRLGESDQHRGGRRQLAQESPGLYDAIKKYDQNQIDRRYEKGADGESKTIRAIDGTLVDNTPAARAAVEKREREWREQVRR